MPITTSAQKKQRQDVRKRNNNLIVKQKVKDVVKVFKSQPTKANLSKAYSLLDRASKKNVFHPNKSARIKSRLTKILANKKTAKTQTK